MIKCRSEQITLGYNPIITQSHGPYRSPEKPVQINENFNIIHLSKAMIIHNYKIGPAKF